MKKDITKKSKKEKRILIVEDNSDLINLYNIVFWENKYEVKISTNWEEALIDIISFKPTFILLDIMMPNVSWFEFLKRFNKDLLGKKIKEKPIIAINSNLSQDSDIKKWMELWANFYFKKSEFTPLSLVDKVNSIIG